MPWTLYGQKGETLTASTSVWVPFSGYNRKRRKRRGRKTNEEKALERREDDEDEGKEEVEEGGEDRRRSKRRGRERKVKFNATAATSPSEKESHSDLATSLS